MISNGEFVARSLACLKYRFLFILAFYVTALYLRFYSGGLITSRSIKKLKTKQI